MTRYLTVLSLCLLFIIGCKKADVASPQNDLLNASAKEIDAGSVLPAKTVVENVHWAGSYDDLSEWGGDPDTQFTDEQMIRNGVAYIRNPYPNGFTHISLTMPSNRSIPGDSLICETSVMNPVAAGSSPYDVIIYLDGSQHDLTVHLVGDASGVSQTSYTLGNQTYTAIPKLASNFSSFVSIKVGTKKGQTGVYLNGKLAFGVRYTAANKLGTIQGITISGKGSPSVDFVKFTNSISNKKIMTEDFNTAGESHVVFY